MSIVTSKSDMHELTARQFAKMVRLEAPLRNDLKKLFKQMSRDFKVVYSSTGSTINTSRYDDELSAILKKHYRKTAKEFRGIALQGAAGKSFYILKETKQENVNLELAEYIDENAPKQAKIINDTTDNMFRNSVIAATALYAMDGINPTSEQIADSVYDDMIKKSGARSEMIAQTEVGNMQSKTQFTEENALLSSGAVVAGNAITEYERVWSAILDNATRIPHAFADGQRTGIDGYFTVDGEQLLYPRDYSNGSPGNTINCRCMTFMVQKSNIF